MVYLLYAIKDPFMRRSEQLLHTLQGGLMYLKSLFFCGFLSELSITCFLICCKEALFAWTFTTLAHCDLIINGFSCYCYAIFQFHGVFEIGYVPFNICRRWFRALAMVILSRNLITCLPVSKIFSRKLLFPSLHLSYHCTSIGFCRIC